jgi:pimeloyl-ACP methyl ester carboxylesterase
MLIQRYWPEGSGWRLDVRSYHRAERLDPERRPLLLVPGYCMNTTPLLFHPEGPSMIEFLTERGFEVWTVNLRGQGESACIGGARDAGFREMALCDLPLALEQVRAHTQSRAQRVDVIGCSLGGTYLFTYLAHHRGQDALGSVVGLGAPLRWVDAHPLLRAFFASSRVASRIRISGTRKLAELALPLVARHLPGLLSIYMNTSLIDLSCASELVKTVEDPIPKLNGEIARWIKSGDLTVEGVNVTEALRGTRHPFLAIVANRDGIVPPAAAKSALEVFPAGELVEVGDDATWFSHADLFISRHAQRRVFEPLAAWLEARGAE